MHVPWPKLVQAGLAEGGLRLDFCTEVYQYQVRHGRHFLHEHPAGAASWVEDSVQEVASLPGVAWAVGHMCQYGMTLTDRDGKTWPIMKPTRWLSSAPAILRRLGRQCPNSKGAREGHKHMTLLGRDKTEKAAEYPPELCR